MADFKLGNIEFTIEAFAGPEVSYPSLLAHLEYVEHIKLFSHNCEKPISRSKRPSFDIGANIIFVEEEFRLKGFRKKYGFDHPKFDKAKQAKFDMSRIDMRATFLKAAGLTNKKLKSELAELFTPLVAKFPKSYVDIMVPKYCFDVRLAVINRIVMGRAKGSNFDYYFEMTYPLLAHWHLSKIDDCNPYNDEHSFLMPGVTERNIPSRPREEVKLGKKKATQKKVDEIYKKYQDALEEFWESDATAELFKKKFKESLDQD